MCLLTGSAQERGDQVRHKTTKALFFFQALILLYIVYIPLAKWKLLVPSVILIMTKITIFL